MMESPDDVIEVYTDGSGSTKDKTGGWAFVMRYNGRMEKRFGNLQGTTSNAMELTAIVRCLQFVALNDIPLKIMPDSEYAKNCLQLWHIRWAREAWLTANGNEVVNKELIKDGLELLRIHRQYRRVDIVWIAGHKHHWNEYADRLAHYARVDRTSNWGTK